MIPIKTYRNYLIDLKDDIYTVLCLYEEKVDTFDSHLNSLLFELRNLSYVVEDDLPHRYWYVKTLSKLEGISRLESGWQQTKRVKKETFDLMNRIDKQISELKEG